MRAGPVGTPSRTKASREEIEAHSERCRGGRAWRTGALVNQGALPHLGTRRTGIQPKPWLFIVPSSYHMPFPPLSPLIFCLLSLKSTIFKQDLCSAHPKTLGGQKGPRVTWCGHSSSAQFLSFIQRTSGELSLVILLYFDTLCYKVSYCLKKVSKYPHCWGRGAL